MFIEKRRGFTLAEVLITLGIIGVVAALTTPAIIRNSANAKIGPTLAKISTTLETAIQAACTDQEKYYLKHIINYETNGVTLDDYIKLLAGKYMKAKPGTAPSGTLVDMQGNGYTVGSTYYEFPDKSAISYDGGCTFGSSTTTGEDGQEVTTNINKCEIFAFMPGYQTKHRLTLGIDFFPLMITEEGNVEPPGDDIGSCTDANIDAGETDGYDCVNRVALNGWKADY